MKKDEVGSGFKLPRMTIFSRGQTPSSDVIRKIMHQVQSDVQHCGVMKTD